MPNRRGRSAATVMRIEREAIEGIWLSLIPTAFRPGRGRFTSPMPPVEAWHPREGDAPPAEGSSWAEWIPLDAFESTFGPIEVATFGPHPEAILGHVPTIWTSARLVTVREVVHEVLESFDRRPPRGRGRRVRSQVGGASGGLIGEMVARAWERAHGLDVGGESPDSESNRGDRA